MHGRVFAGWLVVVGVTSHGFILVLGGVYRGVILAGRRLHDLVCLQGSLTAQFRSPKLRRF